LEFPNVTTGAIQQDAPAAAAAAGDVDLNDPNTRLPREDAMAAMVARRREALVADGVDLPPAAAAGAPSVDEDTDTGDATAEAARTALAAQAAAETAAIADAGAQVANQRAEPVLLDGEALSRYQVKKKVNGVETIVPLEDVVRSAQKIDAADVYLAQAKQTVVDAVAVAEAARKAAGAGVVNAPAPAENQAPDQNQVDQDTAIGEFVTALFQGDEAAARAKLVAALNRSTGGKPAFDPDALVATVEQRIAVKTAEDSVKSAIKSMLETYPEIAKSQALRVAADDFLAKETGGQALTGFAPTKIHELVQQAGKATMDWFRPNGGGTSQQLDPKALNDRREQKQGIDEPQRASGRAVSSSPLPKTNSDRIAEMAAHRMGQAGRK
jgi:hypothetical protein